ncbi:MAG TPA: tRNA 2-thiouridine(34) synthase MnmA [Candidatus Paceibacterota bacterium]|nr:tRNA 2-thiouridine(34) synthase MnmA [Candidatus Paceibacterota bacterium]
MYLRQPRQTKNRKVFVGLSGGVDSAVSAALLQKEGYEVTGVFIRIQISGYPCPAAQDRIEAMRVAAHLRIPFIEIDLSKEYEREVFGPTLKEFSVGRTPNPDTLCNEKIKFGIFFDYCRSQGAEFIATGHYARVVHNTNSVEMWKGTDSEKDQSYFLWGVGETKLRHTLFPVGQLKKTQVRELAKKFSLPNAARHDSQGLCFLGNIELEDMLKREIAPTPGDVLSEDGAIVGTHQGTPLYTLGQRHGFTLFTESPEARAQYIVQKDMSANTLTVSPSKFPRGLSETQVIITGTNWIGDIPDGPAQARYRYRQNLIPASLVRNRDNTMITLREPHYVPLGQSLVLYRGERCLGGGVISSATLIE